MKVDKLILLLEDWKSTYPFDPEKTVKLIQKYTDTMCRSSHLSGLEIDDNYNGKDTKGVDLELPDWMEDNIFGDRYSSAYDLQELAKLNKKVKDLISDSSNFKFSWGETTGMMPAEDSKYPKDAIVTNIWGNSDEPHADISFADLMDVAKIKPKHKEMFKKFLNEDWTRRNIALSSSEAEVEKLEDEDSLTFYDVFEINFAIYLKKKDFMEAVKGAKSKEEKELIKSILERVGNYE